MNYINGVKSLENKLPLTEEQVKLLEEMNKKAEGTAQEDKKDDETVPF
jgi:hypothetical protein